MTTRHSAALAASTIGLREAPVFRTQLWHGILADTSQTMWSQLCLCHSSPCFIHSTEFCAMFGVYTTWRSVLPARVKVRTEALLWRAHLYHADFNVCIHFAL